MRMTSSTVNQHPQLHTTHQKHLATTMPAQQSYYKNTLQPIQVNQATLQRTLKELQQAVIQGTKVVQNGSPASVNPADSGSIYSGTAGIALAFLRLERQKEFLVDDEHRDTTTNTSRLPNFAKLAHERIIPPVAASDTRLPPPGRMSPIGSSLGPLIVRVLAACEDPKQPVSQDDTSVLNGAVQHSLSHGYVVTSKGSIRGVDEVLYGRAGLLWAVLNVRCYTFDKALQTKLKPVFDAVPRLADAIIDGGRRGARDFAEMNGEEDAFPLMWPYKDERYSLGAVHGIAGILTILLSCEAEELENHLPLIAETITGLCQICIAQHGHLPSSIPPRSSSRSTHLVQICHGTPGLLVLLATARRNHRIKTSFWQPEWDQAIQLGAEKAWQEGLLTKGGSLCHGLAGNAWSLLMLHNCFESDSDDKEGDQIGDYFLSRALSLLLLARESPPYSTALNIPSSYNFRTPDRPYSLYEGLAGELCAWTEACVVIKTRLCKLGLDEKGERVRPSGKKEFQQHKVRELGFPCLGGNGPKGIL